MSGILRSALRLVGTSKYAKNNLSQYLRTMASPKNNFNASLALSSPDDLSEHPHNDLSKSVPSLLDTQAEMKSKSFWELMRLSANEIFTSKLPDHKKTLSSILGNFIVTQSSGTIDIITNNKHYNNFIFPPVFITESNGKLVEPTSDTIASEEKGPRYFRGDGLNLLLDGDKLKFKVENSDETFILNHAVHVTALKKPTQILKGGGVNVLPSIHFDDMTVCDAKLTLKTPKNEEHRTYKTGSHTAPSRQWDGFGDYGLMNTMEDRKKTAAELYADAVATAAIVKYPGSVKLQFPMDLSLQGFKQTIKIKETGETFIVCHTVNLKVLKESGDKIKNKESKNPKIDVLIQSGDINFKLLDGSYQGMRLRHEVSITLTDDNQMYITPMTKFRMIEE